MIENEDLIHVTFIQVLWAAGITGIVTLAFIRQDLSVSLKVMSGFTIVLSVFSIRQLYKGDFEIEKINSISKYELPIVIVTLLGIDKETFSEN